MNRARTTGVLGGFLVLCSVGTYLLLHEAGSSSPAEEQADGPAVKISAEETFGPLAVTDRSGAPIVGAVLQNPLHPDAGCFISDEAGLLDGSRLRRVLAEHEQQQGWIVRHPLYEDKVLDGADWIGTRATVLEIGRGFAQYPLRFRESRKPVEGLSVQIDWMVREPASGAAYSKARLGTLKTDSEGLLRVPRRLDLYERITLRLEPDYVFKGLGGTELGIQILPESEFPGPENVRVVRSSTLLVKCEPPDPLARLLLSPIRSAEETDREYFYRAQFAKSLRPLKHCQFDGSGFRLVGIPKGSYQVRILTTAGTMSLEEVEVTSGISELRMISPTPPEGKDDVLVDLGSFVLADTTPLIVIPGRLNQSELVQYLTWDSIVPLRLMRGPSARTQSEEDVSRDRERLFRFLLDSARAGAHVAERKRIELPRGETDEFTGIAPGQGYFHLKRQGRELLSASSDVSQVTVRVRGFDGASAVTFLETGASYGGLTPAAIDAAWRVSLDGHGNASAGLIPGGKYAVAVLEEGVGRVLMTRTVLIPPGKYCVILERERGK